MILITDREGKVYKVPDLNEVVKELREQGVQIQSVTDDKGGTYKKLPAGNWTQVQKGSK